VYRIEVRSLGVLIASQPSASADNRVKPGPAPKAAIRHPPGRGLPDKWLE
jgi:hypothetical protein